MSEIKYFLRGYWNFRIIGEARFSKGQISAAQNFPFDLYRGFTCEEINTV